jgi:enolase-phosphatase E1
VVRSVKFGLRQHGIKAIVLDIEGTTTPIEFVHNVLFSFARANLHAYLEHLRTDSDAVMLLRSEWQDEVARGETPPAWPGESYALAGASYVEWLMDRDRKSPGLKLLQGQIWEQGYRGGALRGEVFPDVAPAFHRWRDAGVPVAIYSSGSQLAQRLLFGTTRDGDLTTLISRFFDTAVGAKTSAESYARIATELGVPADQLVFVSDVVAELDAARTAGCQALLCVRPGNAPQPAGTFATIESFDEIE